jgi:hypothetical protein
VQESPPLLSLITTYAGGVGGVVSVAAGDASMAVAGTVSNPTLKTGTLDQIASLHPPAADWSNNSHKITGITPGAATGEATTWDQTGGPNPADFGFLSWTGDPAFASASGLLVSGTLYVMKFFMRKAGTISNLNIHVNGAGSGLTANQNFAALFDAGGTQRGISADQTTNWATTGLKPNALTVPFAATAGAYYAMFMSNGTTPITVRGGGSPSANWLANVGLAGAAIRVGTAGTGATAIPASFVPSSVVVTGSEAIAVVIT